MSAAAMAPRSKKPKTRIASSTDKPNSQSATSDDATEARTITLITAESDIPSLVTPSPPSA